VLGPEDRSTVNAYNEVLWRDVCPHNISRCDETKDWEAKYPHQY